MTILVNRYQHATIPKFIAARMTEVVTTEATRCAKLQSNSHRHQTNTRLLTGWMPFLLPNSEYQNTEGTKYHIPTTCSPQAHLGSSNVVSLAPGYLGGSAAKPLTSVLQNTVRKCK